MRNITRSYKYISRSIYSHLKKLIDLRLDISIERRGKYSKIYLLMREKTSKNLGRTYHQEKYTSFRVMLSLVHPLEELKNKFPTIEHNTIWDLVEEAYFKYIEILEYKSLQKKKKKKKFKTYIRKGTNLCLETRSRVLCRM